MKIPPSPRALPAAAVRTLTRVFLLLALAAGACGSYPGTARKPTRDRAAVARVSAPALRLLPGYDSATAVVVGVSEALDSAFLAASRGPGARALLDERLHFYASILASSPEVRLILFVDRPGEADAARSALRHPDRLSVVVQPSWVWMRDFAPLTAAVEGGGRALVAYTPYQLGVNRTIADEVGLPLVRGAGTASRTIEGGNVLVDAEGRCYTAVWSLDPRIDPKSAAEVRDLKGMCPEVRTLPKMPYEQTGHLDIFARFLDASTVLVADYADEGFHVAATPIERRYTCTSEQVARAAWSACAAGATVYPDMSRLRQTSAVHGQPAPMTVRWSDAMPALRGLYPGARIDSLPDYPWMLRQQLDRVADLFVSWGFHVVRVRNPAPYLALDRARWLDPSGRVVRSAVSVQPVFPTYVNALLLNGVVYLPRYATASSALNQRASMPYENHGYRAVRVDMTQDIAFRGATRCLTLEIHGGSGSGERGGPVLHAAARAPAGASAR